MTTRYLLPLAVALAATLAPWAAQAQTPLGSEFTYQGQLKEGGLPFTGSANLRFQLYDADAGGMLVGTHSVPNVPINNGLFTATLDFGGEAFFGDARWLEIAVYQVGVGYVTLSPRQPLTAAPYALYALNGGGGGGSLWSQNGSDIYYNLGDVGIGTSSPSYPLHIESPAAVPLYSHTTSADGAAVDAEATSSSGTVNGVFAQTASTEGSGVFGQNTSPSGDNEGVFGVSWSPLGKGVFGYNGSSSSSAIGVLGRTANGYGVRGEATGGGFGVYGYSATDWSVAGVSPQNSGQAGVVGAIINHTGGMLWKPNSGVSGSCEDGQGVAGRTFAGVGVWGEQVNSGNVGQLGTSTEGVHGETANPDGKGVVGLASSWDPGNGVGVYGEGFGWDGIGVYGKMSNEYGLGAAVKGEKGDSTGYLGHDMGGVYGSSTDGDGVSGFSSNSRGVVASSTNYVAGSFWITNADNPHRAVESTTAGSGNALYAENTNAAGDTPAVYGKHAVTDYYGIGVQGIGGYHGVDGRVTATGSSTYIGVYAQATGGTGYCSGVHAQATGGGTNRGVYGTASGGTTNYAGYFSGNVTVTGTLSKGGGSFKIDHPLDPENKYLLHSFVESPDMMNVYNGNVVTDEKGYVTVTLPEWFETLNRDFRYQLTVLGQFAQAIVAEKIHDNKFVIRTDKPSVEVSWQVTGIRHDPFAEANRIPVEQDKPAEERGTYLHPEARGLPGELQLDRVLDARADAARSEPSR